MLLILVMESMLMTNGVLVQLRIRNYCSFFVRCSTIVVLQSVFSFVLQAFAYPWIAKYVSIPYLASIGMAIQFVSYILMGAINNVYGNVTASFILWAGYCCSSPTSASILTVEISDSC